MRTFTSALKQILLFSIFLYSSFVFMKVASYDDIVKSQHSNNPAIHALALIYVMAETSLIIMFGMIFSETIVYEI